MKTKSLFVEFHCLKCGKSWNVGDDSIDVDSYGICIECFAEWVNSKKKMNNLKQCFGQFEKVDDVDCNSCSVRKFCKEYYESK